MKKVTLAVLCLLVMAGCNESQLASWVTTSQNNDASVFVGVADANAEVGGVFTYPNTVDLDEPALAGVYLTWFLTQEVGITDTPEYSPLKDILESLSARPYVRLSIVGEIDDHKYRKIQPNWAVGTLFTLTPDSSWAIITEYEDGDQVPVGEMHIGLRGKW